MNPAVDAPAFRPVLGLGALTFFGIAFIGPTAPYTFFGIGSEKSSGHLALVYLIALIAMLFTAVSYGRMANAHPRAGSVYAYATAEVHPLAGFLAGWAMVLDYLFLPIISVIIVGVNVAKVAPAVPYSAWVVGMALAMTLVNLRGIQVTTRFTLVYTVLFALSAIWFVALAVATLRAGGGAGTLFSFRPFYDPATFSLPAVRAAFAITVLSFLGFDGVSTLAEDAKDPRRDIPRATLLACLVCGVSFVVLTYLAQLVWPDWRTLQPLETGFSDVARQVGGMALFAVVSAFVLGQAAISGVASQASASRLLFGMSREGRLPHTLFGHIHPTLNTPIYSVLLIGLVSAIVPLFMTLDKAAELVNFGACLGFILVNVSALLRAWRERRAGEVSAWQMLAPLVGAAICSWIWFSLTALAMELGVLWITLGLLWLAWMTRGRFRLDAGGPASAHAAGRGVR
jgi:amino acid transporter